MKSLLVLVLFLNVDPSFSQNCKTNDGLICIFPFVYRGNKYSSCTNADWGSNFWCPTNDVVNGVYMENSNNYGICHSNCPRQPTPDQPLPTPTFPPIKTTAANITVSPLPSTIQNGTITPSNIRTPKPLTDNVTVSPLPSTIQNGTITPSNIRTPKPPTDNVTCSLLLTTIEEETIAPNVTERCLTVDDRECQFPIIIGNTSISMCISIGLGDGVYFCPVHTLPDGMATPDSLSVLGICKPDCPRLIPMPIAITEDMSSTPDINKTPQFGTLPPNTPFPITTATTTMNTITTT
nr:mucin-2-like isoform X2 [Lepeophtheirus salmonis]